MQFSRITFAIALPLALAAPAPANLETRGLLGGLLGGALTPSVPGVGSAPSVPNVAPAVGGVVGGVLPAVGGLPGVGAVVPAVGGVVGGGGIVPSIPGGPLLPGGTPALPVPNVPVVNDYGSGPVGPITPPVVEPVHPPVVKPGTGVSPAPTLPVPTTPGSGGVCNERYLAGFLDALRLIQKGYNGNGGNKYDKRVLDNIDINAENVLKGSLNGLATNALFQSLNGNDLRYILAGLLA